MNLLCYKLKGSQKEHHFEIKDGKTECPICKSVVKNIHLHMSKNTCIISLDADHFEEHYELYKNVKLKTLNKERKNRWKEKNQELHNERNLKYVKKSQSKKRISNFKEYKKEILMLIKSHRLKLKKMIKRNSIKEI